MSKVTIVTDSTAYIPKEYTAKHQIQVAPQVLIWGNETYEDGVDITPEVFYRRLSTAKIMPSSSQVSIKTFDQIFKSIREKGNEVLAILISEKLSGTIDSAVKVKEYMADTAIEIVDSRTTAMALGFIAIETAKAAEQGATLAECKALAEHLKGNTGLAFAVDTLEFLHRGGRIGGASRLLGSALNIKPILELVDGRVEPIERVRTRSKSMSRVVEIIGERIGGREPVHLATLHANARTDAIALLEEAKAQIGGVEHILSEVSPVVGTHAGPGTLGLAFLINQ